VGTVKKATNILTDLRYFERVKAGRNVEFVVAPQRDPENP
jgi:hypothetical protein